MNNPTDFIDEPALPTAKPGSVKTFREMLDEAVITARSGDTEYAHEVLDVVMTHLGRRISPAWADGRRAGYLEMRAEVAGLEDRLDRARRSAHLAQVELGALRTRRTIAHYYRRSAVWSAIADVLATKLPTRGLAEDWADEAMDAIREATP